MDKLFLNNLQDINKLLWWINQRGQFCPQNPVKSPRQNNHHHNQAVIQTRTPPNPKPLPSSGPSLPTWIYKPTPLHLSTLGKSHSVATFQRPPKSIGCLPSMKLWGFFGTTMENSTSSLLKNQLLSPGRHSKKNLIPCISFTLLSSLPQIRKSCDGKTVPNAKFGDVFWAEVQAPCYYSRPDLAAQRHNLAEWGTRPLLLHLATCLRRSFILRAMDLLLSFISPTVVPVLWVSSSVSSALAFKDRLCLILRSICPRSVCQGHGGSSLPGTWVYNIMLLINMPIPSPELPLPVLLALSWLKWHWWYIYKLTKSPE